MIEVEFNYVTVNPLNTLERLQETAEDYKAKHTFFKIGITCKEPQTMFDEHRLSDEQWERMVVLYKTRSSYIANTIEFWLIDKLWEFYFNEFPGKASEFQQDGDNYLYVLLG